MSDRPTEKETITQKRAKLVRTNHIEEYDLEGFKQQQLARQRKRFKKQSKVVEQDSSRKEL